MKTKPKMKKIPSWPDGRWKKWYEIYVDGSGTILLENIPTLQLAKETAVNISKRNKDNEIVVSRVLSGGGWFTKKADKNTMVCSYYDGRRV